MFAEFDQVLLMQVRVFLPQIRYGQTSNIICIREETLLFLINSPILEK